MVNCKRGVAYITAQIIMIMEYTVTHNKGEHRFESGREGHRALVEYELDHGVMDIYHTWVPEPIEGQGVGSAIMKEVLDYARDHHYRVVPSCAFAQLYLAKHREYLDLLQ